MVVFWSRIVFIFFQSRRICLHNFWTYNNIKQMNTRKLYPFSLILLPKSLSSPHCVLSKQKSVRFYCCMTRKKDMPFPFCLPINLVIDSKQIITQMWVFLLKLFLRNLTNMRKKTYSFYESFEWNFIHMISVVSDLMN